jgi:hypothetical protein
MNYDGNQCYIFIINPFEFYFSSFQGFKKYENDNDIL